MRYLDPALNGGIKNGCQGDKRGNAWCSNWAFLLSDKCHTVYIVEGPINALSIESAGMPGAGVIATMGTENVEKIDWRFLRGKRVLICLDHNDKVQTNEKSKLFGYRAGLYFAWRLHELLTSCDVPAQLVDQDKWPEGKDVNDLLQAEGMKGLAVRLLEVEEWLVPGLNPMPTLKGKSRVYLANHHYRSYVRFRVTADTMKWITGYKTVQNEDNTKTETPNFEEITTFRLAALSRISIQSPTATMTGDTDASPKTLFAVSVQTARHKNKLIRAVFEDRHLHKIDRWDRFGSVLSQSGFRRMVAVMETMTDIGARDAVNLVGLGWRNGKLSVNEGNECYFSDPEKQCPYANLVFPRGGPADGRQVVREYQQIYKYNAGLQLLVWALGGHLKVILGFWPHLTLQGRKGMGKSTTVKALERSIAMTMFSGQSMETPYRIVKSVSYTTHPVGWEEISARSQILIDKAVAVLQESYNHTYTTRGFDDTDFLLCAPVLLSGEDTEPLKSLIGKLVRVQLNDKKNREMPDDVPKFPVRQWLEYLATLDRPAIKETY
ncbi:MAG: toprim domain-containing protein, partial [Usitatibacteraceae bacterium]